LKLHIQEFNQENQSLKKLVKAYEQSESDFKTLELENEQLMNQIEDLERLNAELSKGDSEDVYHKEFDKLS